MAPRKNDENENEDIGFEPLFAALPEEGLAGLSDEDLSALLDEHQSGIELIEAGDEEFVGDLTGEQILSEMERGVAQIQTIKEEQAARVAATEAYEARVAELAALAKGKDEEDEEDEMSAEGADDSAEEGEELAAEGEKEEEEAAEEAAEPEAVVAATAPRIIRSNRRAPVASRERQPLPDDSKKGAVLVAASGLDDTRAGTVLTPTSLAEAMIHEVKRRARPHKHKDGTAEKILIASVDYEFPEERQLRATDIDGNSAKIAKLGSPFIGGSRGYEALTASGGLCAPLTPLYTIPDYAVTDRPVRAALPSFQADRLGVSVPSVSTIGDITEAITVIEEDEDALGGTFALKSCQDMDCPTWTDVPVGIISHCREYGNLNARAWPEGIAHENNLTMAAHARTAETRLLDRIKALSINVTTAHVYNSAFDFMYAVNRAAAGIRYRLRLNREVALRALLPEWVLNLLAAESFAYEFHDRGVTAGTVEGWFRASNVVPAWYLDNVTGGTSQGFSNETASALDDFPDDVQWALFVEGEFLHLDGGVLELGIVRDSSLNSTNDYQVFGETFENVARIGPTQGALWVTSTVCPSGSFPTGATVMSC